MKIEIDLNDILGDEYGAETLQKSVRRQVIEKMTLVVKEGVGKSIKQEMSVLLDKEMKEAVAAQMPGIVDDLINSEYTQVDQWGNKTGKPTTFRQELVKMVTNNMVYKKTDYPNDRNAFTKAVDSIIEENVKTFKAMFKKEVDDRFFADAINYATGELKKKLGVK